MKRLNSFGLGLLLVLAGLGAPAAYAEAGTEDPWDPCFQMGTGTLERVIQSGRTQFLNDTLSWDRSGLILPTSSDAYRAASLSYTGYFSRYTDSSEYRVTNVSYDFTNQEKSVVETDFTTSYFFETVYERFVGFIIDANGSYIEPYAFSGSAGGGEYSTFSREISRNILKRNCDGRSGSGAASTLGQAVELELSSEVANNFQVIAANGTKSHTVTISVEKGSVSGSAKLLVINDPYSTENQFGFASLGFQLHGDGGELVALLKPILISYESTPNAVLAVSNNARTWKVIEDNKAVSSENRTLRKVNSEIFALSALSNKKWLFVGQKTESKNLVLYANAFGADAGSSIRLTTTGGSGKGTVVLKSQSPENCKPNGLKRVEGTKPGDCRVSAKKFGFDGYLNSSSQVIELKIGG
jgi:hypothetical protein